MKKKLRTCLVLHYLVYRPGDMETTEKGLIDFMVQWLTLGDQIADYAIRTGQSWHQLHHLETIVWRTI